MVTRAAFVFASSSLYYTLEELINNRCKFIEEEHGTVTNIQVIDNNKACITYTI